MLLVQEYVLSAHSALVLNHSKRYLKSDGVLQAVIPNYKDGSIVNLMSSILQAFGQPSRYSQLRLLSPNELKSAENVILILVDGLGFSSIKGTGSFLEKFTRGKITTVFPSTTAACVTTFFTGVAPQQHALVGWHTYMKELGEIVVPLRYATRYGYPILANPKDIFKTPSVFEKIKARTFMIHPQEIANSPFNHAFRGRAKRIVYKTLAGLINQISKTAKTSRRKFIYAYWPAFDALSHIFGPESKQVHLHFRQLNEAIRLLIKKLAGTNTIVIITADHGQVTTPKSQMICLNRHPRLMETLALPITGDARIAYCFVKASKKQQFEKYIKKKLRHACTLMKSAELIRQGYFGLGRPSKKLEERIGDYALIMKENYIIKDFLLGEKEHFKIGNHGGTSSKEMEVPLIVIKTK